MAKRLSDLAYFALDGIWSIQCTNRPTIYIIKRDTWIVLLPSGNGSQQTKRSP